MTIHQHVALMVTTIVVLAFVFCVAYESKSKSYRNNYERGAWAVMMHHKCTGNYGSRAYRDVAYKLEDPQTCDDVQEIIRIANGFQIKMKDKP